MNVQAGDEIMAAQMFYNPTSVAEILDVLASLAEKVVIVNGGTDIVERLSAGRVYPQPEAIMYIRNVTKLDYIREDGGHVCVGGIATYKSMLESPLCRPFTGLMQALSEIGSPPIRAIATPAGNLGTAASGADCNAALMALNASVVLASKKAERVLSYEEVCSSSAKSVLRRDELIREIRIPVNKTAASAFIKLAKRKAQDIAQVSACVCLEAEGGICKKATVVLGAVASKTIRAKSMEELILNTHIDAAASSLKGFIPVEASLRSPRNKAYKESVIGVIVGRALRMAYAEIAGRR